ncbi:SDR family oxidoreductase [Flavihumibacter profundi]|uniref:hypothetical protein n=1 Tax=Flavihumibacter profundi TaxID=2716883 RepID=UPI001CC757AF|nr:hypothetical protein [Flavihumibacter profundi]MBZ5858811.1 hypothetical protein [Flavihumibacter profundi]
MNISVSVLCPGGMNTNPRLYQLMSSGNWFVRNSTMSPESVAAIAITGLLNGQTVLIPGKLNRLSLVINKLLPRNLHKYCTRLLTNKVTSPSIIQSINQYETQVSLPASA